MKFDTAAEAIEVSLEELEVIRLRLQALQRLDASKEQRLSVYFVEMAAMQIRALLDSVGRERSFRSEA